MPDKQESNDQTTIVIDGRLWSMYEIFNPAWLGRHHIHTIQEAIALRRREEAAIAQHEREVAAAIRRVVGE